MIVTVLTSKFEGVHGRKPRGTGVWAFMIDNEEHFFRGKYSEAKKAAIRQAKAMSVGFIELCS